MMLQLQNEDIWIKHKLNGSKSLELLWSLNQRRISPWIKDKVHQGGGRRDSSATAPMASRAHSGNFSLKACVASPPLQSFTSCQSTRHHPSTCSLSEILEITTLQNMLFSCQYYTTIKSTSLNNIQQWCFLPALWMLSTFKSSQKTAEQCKTFFLD